MIRRRMHPSELDKVTEEIFDHAVEGRTGLAAAIVEGIATEDLPSIAGCLAGAIGALNPGRVARSNFAPRPDADPARAEMQAVRHSAAVASINGDQRGVELLLATVDRAHSTVVIDDQVLILARNFRKRTQ